jgi:hypothetical protein
MRHTMGVLQLPLQLPLLADAEPKLVWHFTHLLSACSSKMIPMLFISQVAICNRDIAT